MFLKKTALILLAISIYIAYEYNSVKIPSYVEYNGVSEIQFRITVLLRLISFKIINYADKLNIAKKHVQLRHVIYSAMKTYPNESFYENININQTTVSNVNVTIYSSALSNKINKPLLIYYHGGGYCLGSAELYEAYLIELLKQLPDLVIVSVDYRLGPEYPFPIPTDDCYSVASYIIDNSNEFNADKTRIILAGDSAGGGAVAAVSQRLLDEKKQLPKLQILIYPWLQLVDFHSLPSYNAHIDKRLELTVYDMIFYYLGIDMALKSEIDTILDSHEHFGLIDYDMKTRVNSLLDVNLIPEEYKRAKDYYNKDYSKINYHDSSLPDDHLLKRDKKLGEKIKKLFSKQASPLLANDNELSGLPNSYFIIAEYDALKDEALIFSERLKKVGVNVTVKYYEHSYHGVLTALGKLKVSQDIFSDLVNYLKENIF